MKSVFIDQYYYPPSKILMATYPNVFFYKGSDDVLNNIDSAEQLDRVRDSFTKILDGKNLSFLIGSGCSSFKEAGVEVGIPTMAPLADEFYRDILARDKHTEWLLSEFKLDITKKPFEKNLELFLGTLHSLYYYLESTNQTTSGSAIRVNYIIDLARIFIVGKCLNEANRKAGNDKILNTLYQSFYRKLLYRNSNLMKPNIFTTNYDLYSESALDKLGIHYANGFSGGIKKFFNPTIFNYALAERMDLSHNKWSVIDNFFYLYKLHGSINWIEDADESKIFKVREIQEATLENLLTLKTIMIHPTPLKQNASLGSPYADLFREFQKKLMQNNNILITLGYSFSDEHINNIIYQAFTIPSFRLIVFGNPSVSSEIKKLTQLNDPRIWVIGGDIDADSRLHYFDGFVNSVLPNLSNDEIDDKIENAIKTLLGKK